MKHRNSTWLAMAALFFSATQACAAPLVYAPALGNPSSPAGQAAVSQQLTNQDKELTARANAIAALQNQTTPEQQLINSIYAQQASAAAADAVGGGTGSVSLINGSTISYSTIAGQINLLITDANGGITTETIGR